MIVPVRLAVNCSRVLGPWTAVGSFVRMLSLFLLYFSIFSQFLVADNRHKTPRESRSWR